MGIGIVQVVNAPQALEDSAVNDITDLATRVDLGEGIHAST